MLNIHATRGGEYGSWSTGLFDGTKYILGPAEPVTLFRHPETEKMVKFDELGVNTVEEWREALAEKERVQKPK